MKVLALAFMTLMSGCYPKGWRTQDMLLEGAVVASTIADWNQTVGIVHNCEEANPIIGDCGENANPTIYFTSFLILQAIAVRLLPPTYRAPVQGALIGAEVATVWDNEFGD